MTGQRVCRREKQLYGARMCLNSAEQKSKNSKPPPDSPTGLSAASVSLFTGRNVEKHAFIWQNRIVSALV